MAGHNSSNNGNLTPNGLDSQPFTNNIIANGSTSTSGSHSPVDVVSFDRSQLLLVPPPVILRPSTRMHSVVPADFDLNAESNGRNFLEFPPDIQSGEDQVVRYLGVVKSLGPEGERTAVVRTMEGCDVDCSTLGCEGLERLRVAELVQIRHWKDGENSQTYIEHTAAECTPSNTLDSSLVGSRAGSRAPTRPPTPAGS